MSKRKIWLVSGLLIAALLSAVWILNSRGQPVVVSKVLKGSISTTVSETGYVKSLDQYEVQANQSGKLSKIAVSPGQEVKQGQILMYLQNSDLKREKEQAQGQLMVVKGELTIAWQALDGYYIDRDDAKVQWERQKTLLDAGASSQAEFDQAQSSLEKADKLVSGQEEYIAYLENQISVNSGLVNTSQQKEKDLTIYSPMDGVVLDLPLKAGAYVNPGNLLCQIGTAGRLEIQADLLSDDLRDIKVGQQATISAPVLGNQVLRGQVSEIRPMAYAKTSALGVEQRRVPVFISVKDNNILKPGYEVQVAIETARSEGLLVGRESVRNLGDGRYQILKVIENRVYYQDVELGIRNQDEIEVMKGLNEGDLILKDGSLQLPENGRVQAQS